MNEEIVPALREFVAVSSGESGIGIQRVQGSRCVYRVPAKVLPRLANYSESIRAGYGVGGDFQSRQGGKTNRILQ